jgi:hypothetical protein
MAHLLACGLATVGLVAGARWVLQPLSDYAVKVKARE